MVRTDPLSYLSEQLEGWRKAGTYQRLRVLESACEPVATFDGKEVINLASNNYLGLADHPKLSVLINNDGMVQVDDVSGPVDDKLIVSTITTNLMGRDHGNPWNRR